MTGFEPATTRPPGVYSTGLSYIPYLFLRQTLISKNLISHLYTLISDKICRINGIRTCDLHDVNVAL